MKRFLSVIISIVMILALSVNAMAVDTAVSITGDDAANREYKAYKLLNASVSGSNYAYEINAKYKDILVEELGLADTATDKEIVDKISEKTTAEAMRHFSDDVYRSILAQGIEYDATWTGADVTLPQGYWLIADVTDLKGQNKSNSLVMVDTVGDESVTIAAKPDDIRTQKKVDDENDSFVNPNQFAEDDSTLQDTADYDIGDKVPYRIDILTPNNTAAYKYYSFIIKDSVAQGLTYDTDSFKLYVNAEPVVLMAKGSTGVENADFIYEIETDTDTATGVQTAQRLYVYPANGYTTNAGVDVDASKENGGDYLAYFGENPEHTDVNNSAVRFEYECILNENAVIGSAGNPNNYTLKFTNNPFDDGFGETPQDTAVVFTYKITFNKVDSKGTELKGADFTLYKFVAAKEQKTPEEMEAAGYVKNSTANAWGEYVAVATKSTNNATEGQATVFSFNGLDDGLYKLEETATPAGYNGIAPVEFQVIANHVTTLTDTANALTELSATPLVGGALTLETKRDDNQIITGEITANVVNRSGSELPSTGGIGKTIFYVTGSAVFIGAVVFLITKKRMKEEF